MSIGLKLLWIFMNRSLNRQRLPFLLSKCVGLVWLGHTVNVCLNFTLWETAKEFYKEDVSFYAPSNNIWWVHLYNTASSPTGSNVRHFNFSHYEWMCSGYLVLVFICFSLMCNHVQHLFMCILVIPLFFCEVSIQIFSLFKS